jgi:hypothetical protein
MLQRFKDVPDKALSGLNSARSSASRGMRNLYTTAMNNPKVSSAVVLGTGLAAALIWAVRRNGGFRNTQQQVLARVREGFKGERQETLTD